MTHGKTTTFSSGRRIDFAPKKRFRCRKKRSRFNEIMVTERIGHACLKYTIEDRVEWFKQELNDRLDGSSRPREFSFDSTTDRYG